jgi:hypothetical protein
VEEVIQYTACYLINLVHIQLWQFGILVIFLFCLDITKKYSFIFAIYFTDLFMSRMKIFIIFNVGADNDKHRKPIIAEFIQGKAGAIQLPFLGIVSHCA